ncbi:MAG: RNA methyltransferase [Ignavibacteria bacterium]|nr:RNA methyltransferase [Ignavibacteria bacterium]
MVEITEIDDPRISFYRSLRYTPPSHIEANVFIAEGEKVVLRLLRSPLKIHSIFAILDFYQTYIDLINFKMVPEDFRYYAEKSLMEKIVGFHLHSGIMAIGFKPQNANIDELSGNIVALNRINNSENVGQISRICRAFAVNSLLVDEKSTSPFLRRAVRVSMGNIFDLKVRETTNILEDIAELKKRDFSIISCEVCPSSINIYDFSFPEKFVIIFGNEHYGISPEILAISDTIVSIPIQKEVESLNVAIATAIVLNEFNRKKRYRNVAN